jgi:hypothetical protein
MTALTRSPGAITNWRSRSSDSGASTTPSIRGSVIRLKNGRHQRFDHAWQHAFLGRRSTTINQGEIGQFTELQKTDIFWQQFLDH